MISTTGRIWEKKRVPAILQQLGFPARLERTHSSERLMWSAAGKTWDDSKNQCIVMWWNTCNCHHILKEWRYIYHIGPAHLETKEQFWKWVSFERRLKHLKEAKGLCMCGGDRSDDGRDVAHALIKFHRTCHGAARVFHGPSTGSRTSGWGICLSALWELLHQSLTRNHPTLLAQSLRKSPWLCQSAMDC